MKLKSVHITESGRLVDLTQHLTRSDGSVLIMPSPLYLIDDEIVATPQMRVDEHDQVITDLTSWDLYDCDRMRSTGLCFAGPPDTAGISRLVQRYVCEARHLPKHELDEWVRRIVAEATAA